MKLPKKISPNPLLVSTVDIRFDSEVNDSTLVAAILPVLPDDFKKVEPVILHNVPVNQQGMFLPNAFLIKGENFSVSVNSKNIVFENVNDYHGWQKYSEFISACLTALEKIYQPKKITRIGLRYISLFASPEKLSDVLNFTPPLKVNDFSPNIEFYEADYSGNRYNLHLKVAQKGGIQQYSVRQDGMFIDIDISCTENLPVSFNDDLINIINEAHEMEKSVFFNSLNQTFLTSLNPEY